MKPLLSAAVAALVLLPQHALASIEDWTGIYTEITVASDYRFDGFSESNRNPTVQGNLHWALPQHFYIGTFATGVDFHDPGHTNYEFDFYAGKHFASAAGDLNLQIMAVTFPDQSRALPYFGFYQFSGALTHRFGKLTLAAKESWSPDYSGRTGTSWNSVGTAHYALTPWLSADGQYGNLSIERGVDRRYWSFGATARWHFWRLQLAYAGTSVARRNCYYTDWCEPGFVAKLSFGVPISFGL